MLLCLGDVSLPTAAWRKAAILGPTAGLAAVVAGVISGRLALTGGAAISASLAPGPFVLLATTWTPSSFLRGRGGSFLLLLEGAPLLHCV
jgi:hypothetical protein